VSISCEVGHSRIQHAKREGNGEGSFRGVGIANCDNNATTGKIQPLISQQRDLGFRRIYLNGQQHIGFPRDNLLNARDILRQRTSVTAELTHTMPRTF
jgi:hypothetical protein